MLFNRYSVLLGILKSAGSITCKTFVQQKLGGGWKNTRAIALLLLQHFEEQLQHKAFCNSWSCSTVAVLGGLQHMYTQRCSTSEGKLQHCCSTRRDSCSTAVPLSRDGCSTCRPDVNFRARAATSTNALSNVYYPSMIFSMIRHNGQIVSTRKSNQDETRDSQLSRS